MKKFVVAKRVIAVLLCMFLCFVLPLGVSALTEQQVRDIPPGVYIQQLLTGKNQLGGAGDSQLPPRRLFYYHSYPFYKRR